MVHVNEIVIFSEGLGVLIVLAAFYRRLQPLPGRTWLLISFVALVIGWCLTILEGFWPVNGMINIVEHAMIPVSALALTAWLWTIRHRGR